MGRSLWGRLLVLVLLGRLTLVLVTISHPDGGVLVDSEGYLRLARTIEKQGTFTDPEEQDLYWPPGYPLVLILARLLLGRENASIAVSLLQLAMTGGASLLLYRAGREMGSPSGGLAAAWIFAVSPHSALWSLAVMSETLFAFLVIVGLSLWQAAVNQGRWTSAAACGVILAFSALVRPIGLFLVPLWAILGWISLRRTHRRRAFVVASALAAGGALLVGLWVGRNWFERQYFGFSMLSERTFYNFNFAQVFADTKGISRNEAAILIAGSGDPAGLVMDFIRENPQAFLTAQARGVVRTLVGDESSAWARFFGVEGVEGYGILSALLGGDVGGIFVPKETPGSGGALPFLLPTRIYGILHTASVYILAAIGIWVHLRFTAQARRDFPTFALIVLTIAYLLVAPAGAGQARFRIPAEPLLALLAGIGLVTLLSLYPLGRRRTHERTGSVDSLPPRGASVAAQAQDVKQSGGEPASNPQDRKTDHPEKSTPSRIVAEPAAAAARSVFSFISIKGAHRAVDASWQKGG